LRFRAAVLGAAFILSSCTHPKLGPPPTGPKFTVGDPYQSQGEWLYPQVFNSYDVTGLSTVTFDDQNQATADGEAYDPDALAAGSPVLQLPAIVTITNLENGRTMDVRVNDRGPDNPGRIIAVTPKVASMLGFPQDGVAEVEVVLNDQRTAAIDGALGQGPKLTAAPVAGITAQSLGPPGSSSTGAAQDLTPQDNSGMAGDNGQVSGVVTTVPPSPGPLYVEIPGFGSERDADQAMTALYGMPAFVVPVFGGSRTLFAVRSGPYHNVADADAALQALLQRGVSDPEIIIR
jgi:rare lipoprotein A